MLTPPNSAWNEHGSDATAKTYLFVTELPDRFYNFQSQNFKQYLQVNNLSFHKKGLPEKIGKLLIIKQK